MALILLGGCMGPRLGTPEQVTKNVISAADEGRSADAVNIMEAVERRADLRDLVFPQLYSEAKARYERADPRGAAKILRPLAAAYREAISVRLALAYSLFLLRAESDEPSAEDVSELASLLDEIDALASQPPAWVMLARAQNSIDQGDLQSAQDVLARFRQAWDGEPVALAPYVDDLQRYLSSH